MAEEVEISLEDIKKAEAEAELEKIKAEREKVLSAWKPKTKLGLDIKNGKITDFNTILEDGKRFYEPEIADFLIQNLEIDLLMIGQSKGKFGGGKRRVFRQTQKKTQEGNKPKFSTIAVVGNKNGLVGIGFGKSKETVPAREKAIRNAKLNIFKIKRGCGSWECVCSMNHSIPFAVKGKCGSEIMELKPAPKGKGLCIHPECAKIIMLAGIKDIWSRSTGQTVNRVNLIYACEAALRKLSSTKLNEQQIKKEVLTKKADSKGSIKEDEK